MYSTTNMGLTSWDLPADDFDHTQLDANWKALDVHDHTAGRGKQIPTTGISPLAIATDRLADGAVTNVKLAIDSVATANIQDGAVTTSKLAAGSVTNAILASAAVTSDKLDPNIVPLGTVMLWYRGPSSGATPGGGWEIMDGRAWSSITNTLGLSTGSIPDMRNTFARGTDLLNIGTTGGSNTANLAHAHGVNAHNHTVPTHAHGISADGTHLHLWQNGLHMATRTNAFGIGRTFHDVNTNTNEGNTFYSMYIQNLLSNPGWRMVFPNGTTQQEIDAPADMDNAGGHAHGGATGGSGTLTSGSSTATTDSQLGSTSVVPQYVGLVYIMRVR